MNHRNWMLDVFPGSDVFGCMPRQVNDALQKWRTCSVMRIRLSTIIQMQDRPLSSGFDSRINETQYFFFFSFALEFNFVYICFAVHIELLISATSVSTEWISKVKWAEWVVWRIVWNLLEKSFSSCLGQQRKLRKVRCLLIEVVSAASRSVCVFSPVLHTCNQKSMQFLPGSCAATHYTEAVLAPGRLLQSSGERFTNAFS